MAELVFNQEYLYDFRVGAGNLPVQTKFTVKNSNLCRKIGTEEHARKLIEDAFKYIEQTSMGAAILREVMMDKTSKTNTNIVHIWFVGKGNDALSPPGTTNPSNNPVVKWCPLQVMWFYDCGKSTARRNRSFRHGFDGNLIVRSPNEKILAYDDKKADHVLGAQTSAAVLLHELGHLVQYFRKPQYFKTEFTKTWRENQLRLIAHGGNVHMVPDIDAPWEVDNVNWHEQPFIKQCREYGNCEGYKANYSDAVGADDIDDVAIVRVNGILTQKIKVGTTWYHVNAAWKVKSENSVSQLWLKEKKPLQMALINGLGQLNPWRPPGDQIKECYNKFIKPLWLTNRAILSLQRYLI